MANIFKVGVNALKSGIKGFATGGYAGAIAGVAGSTVKDLSKNKSKSGGATSSISASQSRGAMTSQAAQGSQSGANIMDWLKRNWYYVVGAVIVIGAGIFLFNKKKGKSPRRVAAAKRAGAARLAKRKK